MWFLFNWEYFFVLKDWHRVRLWQVYGFPILSCSLKKKSTDKPSNNKTYIKLCLISARAVQAESSDDKYMVSPFTGEKIPADKVQQHMKIGRFSYTSPSVSLNAWNRN